MKGFKSCLLMCVWWNIAGNLCADKYEVNLNNTGPGVISSNLTFGAALYHRNGSVVESQIYKYSWMVEEDVFFVFDTTYGNASSAVSVCFFNMFIVPSRNDMFVDVFEKVNKEVEEWVGNEEKVAKGHMDFELTDRLNGNLAISQKLNYTRPPHCFASKHNITLNATISDVFTNASIRYIWHLGSREAQLITETPDMLLNVPIATDKYFIGVTVVATVHKGACVFEDVNRTVEFSQSIDVKDSIGELEITGSRMLKQGSKLSANAICTGSPPFIVTWVLTGPARFRLIDRTVEVERCDVDLSDGGFTLKKTGNYTLDVQVQNAVSVKKLAVSIRVPVKIPSVIPVLCSMIGVALIFIVVISYVKEKARPEPTTMETANFDFQHYRGQARTLLEKFRHFFRRGQGVCEPVVVSDVSTWQRNRRERTPSYGSIVSVVI